MAEARAEVRPASPVRLPRAGPDGLARRTGPVLERLIHVDGAPVVLRAAQPRPGRVVLAATGRDEAHAAEGLRRLRFWTAVDDDLTPFLERFRSDPLIGASVRATPELRPFRRPMPFEVLAWAVCEQLVADQHATRIKREIVRRHGRRDAASGLVDAPGAAEIAALAPAELERCGLTASRALALVRAAREIDSGRVDLRDDARQADGWRRLRAIPGIGAWTVSVLALHGQGHHDALPAGDLAYLKLVGAALTGRASARATEDEVLAFLAPYVPWRGVAGWHLLHAGPAGAARLLRKA